jgi:hypothetical protein
MSGSRIMAHVMPPYRDIGKHPATGKGQARRLVAPHESAGSMPTPAGLRHPTPCSIPPLTHSPNLAKLSSLLIE